MGKKIIDFETRRNTSRGRKSKAGGGNKSGSILNAPSTYCGSLIFKGGGATVLGGCINPSSVVIK